MTDNIQKLYEIAGIYPDCKARECGLDYCANSSGCGYAEYPPFTAEKQLDLIKFVSNFKVYEVIKHENRKWYMCACIGCDDYYESRSESFDQAVAGLVINLWQDLSDNQKQEIKRILE